MTKLICTLHASDPISRTALLQRFGSKHSHNILDPAIDIRQFKPLINDPFRSNQGVTDTSLVAIAVIEIPAGNALRTYTPDLKAWRETLTETNDTYCTLAVMHPRVFKPDLQQPVHYLYFMKRRTNLCRADYFDYYMNSHYRFGMQTRGIGYTQNYVDSEESARLAQEAGFQLLDCDSVSEMHFYSVEQFKALNTVAEMAQAAAEDEERFVERSASSMICLEPITTTVIN
jgi:hypothetical protein